MTEADVKLITSTPHAVFYDEEKRVLMSAVTINGVTFTSELERANVVSPNGNLYTEECLREGAKKYMENLSRSRGTKDVPLFPKEMS